MAAVAAATVTFLEVIMGCQLLLVLCCPASSDRTQQNYITLRMLHKVRCKVSPIIALQSCIVVMAACSSLKLCLESQHTNSFEHGRTCR